MSQSKLITMDEFTIQETRKFPQATGDLSALLRDIGLAGKIINKQVLKAGLADVLGKHGATNVQGFEFIAPPSQRNYGFDIKVTF